MTHSAYRSRGKSATVGKPFECVTDARAINRAGADAADRRCEIEQRERVGERVHDPADAAEQATDEDDRPRAKAVHQIAFDRNQPRFG